jgi:hypothetical protein
MKRGANVLALALALAACTPDVRFPDRAILWREPDDAPIAMPKERETWGTWMGVRDTIFAPADRVLALDGGRESENVNALDEVPDSTWFRDPRRVVDASGAVRLRELGAEALTRGRIGADVTPVPPYTVTRGKAAGANAGFVVKDARGVKYAFKFDPPGLAGLDTSTEVVVARLAWAAGWLVPDETLVDVRPSELVLAPDAKSKDGLDRTVPFSREAFDRAVAHLPRQPGGTLRAIASRWIEGRAIGPFTWFGRRADDPNDRVPHEDRRDLRAFGVFSAWVNNVDALETNTFDTYVGKNGRGHVEHYQQDVGGAFGARAVGPVQFWMGSDVYLSPRRILTQTLTLGIAPRPWDGERVRRERAELDAKWPELGFFDADHFDARGWEPVLENPAFARQTARDRYWGAKRIAAFSDGELRAAIATGRYRPETAERLFDVLSRRRRMLLRAAFGDVAALDAFAVDARGLCFDDLWLRAGLGGSARYTAHEHGAALDVRPAATAAATADARATATACVALPPRDGYRVIVLAVRRAGERTDARARVHLVEDAGERRIVGVDR